MTELEQRAAVVAEARTWIGTPYHPMGRVKGVGVDCAMLPAEVYAAVGLIPEQPVEYYPRDWHLHRSTERYLSRVLQYAHPVGLPGPGDLILWRVGRCMAHGAIVTAWPRVVHAAANLRVIEDDGDGPSLNTVGRGAKRERLFFSLWGTA